MDPISSIANAVGSVVSDITALLGIKKKSKADLALIDAQMDAYYFYAFNDPNLAGICAESFDTAGQVSPICRDAGISANDIANAKNRSSQEQMRYVGIGLALILFVAAFIFGVKNLNK